VKADGCWRYTENFGTARERSDFHDFGENDQVANIVDHVGFAPSNGCRFGSRLTKMALRIENDDPVSCDGDAVAVEVVVLGNSDS
jgi:hypothetical protein